MTTHISFFSSPYYVYKYAVAITVSFKLFKDVKKNNTDNLVQFLKAGGHKDPLEILQDIGVDLNEPTVYQPLLDNLQKMLAKLKMLLTK